MPLLLLQVGPAAARLTAPPTSSAAAASVFCPNKNPVLSVFVVSDYAHRGRASAMTIFSTEILVNTIFRRRHSIKKKIG